MSALSTSLRHGAGLLPRPLRYALYRRQVHLELEPPAELTVRLARTREELETAYRILHDAYSADGLMPQHPSGMRVPIFFSLPATSTAIATWNDRIVATVSFVRDGVFGVPMGRYLDVSVLRRKGARSVEISALAVERGFRGHHGRILFALFRFVTLYAERCIGCDNVACLVESFRADLYRGLMAFHDLPDGHREQYEACTRPVDGLFTCICEAREALSALYPRWPRERDLQAYLFGDWRSPGIQLPDRAYHTVTDPVMTPDLLDYFFNQRTDGFARLRPEQAAILWWLYDHDRYGHVLPRQGRPGVASQRRVEPRFDVRCRGVLQLRDDAVAVTVHDASEHGLSLMLGERVRLPDVVRLDVAVAPGITASLRGRPSWARADGALGLRVVESDAAWHHFIGYLDARRQRPASSPLPS